MSDIKNGQPDDAGLSPIEASLPWYATGRLSAPEQAQVEAALAGDDELRRRLALLRDEQAETISLNERLGTPPAAAMDRLMAKIDLYETQHPRSVALSEKLLGWMTHLLSGLSPRALAWSATAAAVVICLEGAMLTGLITERQQAAHFTTASLETQNEGSGTYALISFVGTVSLQEMSTFLTEHHATLLEGPKPGGFYRVKIADQKLTGAALNSVLDAFRTQKSVVSLILPEAAKP